MLSTGSLIPKPYRNDIPPPQQPEHITQPNHQQIIVPLSQQVSEETVKQIVFLPIDLLKLISTFLDPLSIFQFTQVNKRALFTRYNPIGTTPGLVTSLTLRALPAPDTPLLFTWFDQVNKQMTCSPNLKTLTINMAITDQKNVDILLKSEAIWNWKTWVMAHEQIFSRLETLNINDADENQLVFLIEGLTHLIESDKKVALRELNIWEYQAPLLPKINFPATLQQLTISADNLISLPDGILNNLTLLELFSLNCNSLTHLPNTLFASNAQLTYLYLRLPELFLFPDGLLANQVGLEEFELYTQRLTTISHDTFQHNTSLLWLDFSVNSLKILPKGLLQAQKGLEELKLSAYSLIEISADTFQNNTSLRALNINARELQQLPANLLATQVLLEELELCADGLTEISHDTFQHNTSLLWLDISVNALKTLPKGLLQAQKGLEELNLSANSLIALPADTFQNTTSLRSLNINAHQLQKLPTKLLATQTALKKFNLLAYKLIEIPSDIFQYTGQLQNLSIGTPAFSVSTALFHHLGNLNDLNFTVSSVSYPALFKHNTQLKFLYLTTRQISDLPDTLFDTQEKLEFLSLTAGRLKKIPPILFQHATNLKALLMNVHALQILPAKLLEQQIALHTFKLKADVLTEVPSSLLKHQTHLIDLQLNVLALLKPLPRSYWRDLVSSLELKAFTQLMKSLQYFKKMVVESQDD